MGKNDDNLVYRIAVWAEEPRIEYLHAGSHGQLVDEAVALLRNEKISDLYDPKLPGEYFPPANWASVPDRK